MVLIYLIIIHIKHVCTCSIVVGKNNCSQLYRTECVPSSIYSELIFNFNPSLLLCAPKRSHSLKIIVANERQLINQEFCRKHEAGVTRRSKQADVGFNGLSFPKGKKKSSCHQTVRAAGTETAAVRVEK